MDAPITSKNESREISFQILLTLNTQPQRVILFHYMCLHLQPKLISKNSCTTISADSITYEMWLWDSIRKVQNIMIRPIQPLCVTTPKSIIRCWLMNSKDFPMSVIKLLWKLLVRHWVIMWVIRTEDVVNMRFVKMTPTAKLRTTNSLVKFTKCRCPPIKHYTLLRPLNVSSPLIKLATGLIPNSMVWMNFPE